MDTTRPILALVAILSAGAARADPAGDVACKRDLLIAESAVGLSRERLEKAGEALPERCRVWRQHVATMRRTSASFRRCLATPDKTRRAAELNASAAEFDGLVRDQCLGR